MLEVGYSRYGVSIKKKDVKYIRLLGSLPFSPEKYE